MKTPQQKLWIGTLALAALIGGSYLLLQRHPANQTSVSNTESNGTLDGNTVALDPKTGKPLAPSNSGASPNQSGGSETLAAGTGISEGRAPASAENPNQCFLATFNHKKLPTHDDPETCQRHKNIIKLDHALNQMKNVCVRIDGEAVEYQKVKNEPKQILIAGGAGPDSKITVRYCIGAQACPQDCKVQKKKDSFLDAVGGQARAKNSDDEGKVKVLEWDPEKTGADGKKLIQAVGKEIDGFQEDLKNDADERNEVFASWIANEPELAACATAHTANLNQ